MFLLGYLQSQDITLSIHPVAYIDYRSKNMYSTRAAAAVACAFDAGKLLEFHSYLLRNQPDEDTVGPTDQKLIGAGQTLGMGQGFADCVSGQHRLGWVGQATKAASAAGVKSVPAAFVDGQEVDTVRSDLITAVSDA